MSGVPDDDGLLTWEQLLTGLHAGSAVPCGSGPRHLRWWPAEFSLELDACSRAGVDGGLSWGAAAGWTLLAAGCAGVVAHAAVPLMR